MTANPRAYQANQAYRGASIALPPLSGIVMLLDGAIINLKKTVQAAQARRMEESHSHLVRSTAILRGLSLHLSFELGGPLAERLFKTYNLLILACLASFGRPDASERYERLITSIVELRDAWAAVAAQSQGSRSTRI